MKLLELTSDSVFKSFMLSENTKNYKARLIHLVTKLPEEDLKKALYTSEENPYKTSKVMRNDIIARIDGHIINLEMNNTYYDTLSTRNSKYMHRLSSVDLAVGEDYINSRKIIQINIDDFHNYKGDKFIYEFKMREKDTMEVENDLIVSYHIDLKYLEDRCYNDSEIEKLFRLFITEDIDSLRGDPIMDEAIKELENLSIDPRIIGLYDAEQMAKKVENSKIREAEEKALSQGLTQGHQEKSIEIAKSMLKDKVDISKISLYTGLTIEEIKNISDE